MAEAEAQAALHGAAREAEALGDRAVREALEVGELDDGALFLRESCERGGEAGLRGVIIEDAREGFLRVLVRDRLGGVRDRTAAILVRRDFEVARARSAPGEVDGSTMDDGHDECVQPAMFADAVSAFPEREEGGVDGILGGCAVAEDAVGETEGSPAMGTIELRERRSVAGLEPAGEFTIIGGWRDVAAPLAGYSRGDGRRITAGWERAGRATIAASDTIEAFRVIEVIQRRSSCESPASRLREPVPGEES